MKLITKQTKGSIILKGFFNDDKLKEKNILNNKFSITEYLDKNIAYINLGDKKCYCNDCLETAINKIVKLNTRNFEIDASSFTTKDINLSTVVKRFVEIDEYVNGEVYSAKTKKEDKKASLSLIVNDSKASKEAQFSLRLAKLVNNTRRLQVMPPNICNSEWLAKEISSMFKNIKSPSLKVKVLNKKEIETEKMNLFLSVNRGSAYEPQLVVIEYNGNPKSKDKIALIGKGITFDSGGYNLKGTQHIQGMKFDMSGAAICANAIKGIIDEKAKVNVCAVLPLTDNKISSTAQTPDSIWTSMNGKTVEVNNTDAEGRLVLADAITYAIKKFKPTQIIDVATLTGAIIIALGVTYTGTWSTCDKAFNKLQSAADKQNELIWRMPFHKDFAKNIKSSKFADLKNTDFSGRGGSASAAMFLKEFTEDIKYIHLDVAGSAGDGDNPTGVMVKTLIQFALDSQE